MRMPTYGGVISFAAVAGVAAFVCVLIMGSPRERPQPAGRGGGNTARVDGPPSDPDGLEEWLGKNPDSPRWWLELGNARHDQGRGEDARRAWAESLRLYEARLARGETLRPGSWYNRACCMARLGDGEGALEGLRKAVEMGWGDADHTRADLDFESLRDDPRFEEIVRTMPDRRVYNAG